MATSMNICAICYNSGDFECQRCGETYCSSECQKKDWREHRRNCVPMPRLIPRSGMRLMSMPASLSEQLGYDATDMANRDSVSELNSRKPIAEVTSAFSRMKMEKLPKMEHKPINMQTDLINIEKVLAAPASNTPINSTYGTAKNSIKGSDDQSSFILRKKSTNSLTKNQTPSTVSIGNKSQVFITHVQDHRTVFVHPENRKTKWLELIEAIKQYAKSASHLNAEPCVGDIVLVFSQNCDSFARAAIKKKRSSEQIFMVDFLDYGFTGIVKQAEVMQISNEFANYPRYVNKITIKQVSEKIENTDLIMKYLVKFQEKQTILVVKNLEQIEKTNSSAHISGDLCETEKFSSISHEIKRLIEEDKKAKGAENSMEIPFSPFSGEDIEMLILDNSTLNMGCFSAVRGIDTTEFSSNDASINSEAERIAALSSFMPKLNEVCLAQSNEDKRWYRAMVYEEKYNGIYGVLYLDYGNMEHVPVENIRKMEQKFCFPRLTATCFIDGIKDDNIEGTLLDRLKSLLQPFANITLDKIECSATGDATCKSNQILQTLRSENLI